MQYQTLKHTKKKYSINDFILQDLLGEGSFGKVYRIEEKQNHQIFAAKISKIEIKDNDDNLFSSLSHEVNILAGLNHPSILKFIFYHPFNFKNKPKPTIITEYAVNGSLSDLIEHDRQSPHDPYLTDTRKLILLYGICTAMAYLHSYNIIHRDLKPKNILIDEYMHPKIADFGLSKSINNESINLNAVKGTPRYISPEIWLCCDYTKYSDVYAFSIIAYELMTLQEPYKDLDLYSLIMNVYENKRPNFDVSIPKAYEELIKKCWSNDQLSRPKFDEIAHELRSNKKFITEKVDVREFQNYVDYIDGSQITFNETNIIISNKAKNKGENEIIKDWPLRLLNFPYKYLKHLSIESIELIKRSESGQISDQFKVGRCLIEGLYDFPIDSNVGWGYIKKSIDNGCKESLIYFINHLIKGKIIPQNIKKARKLIEKLNNKGDEAIYYYLLGKLYKKGNQFEEAKKSFTKSIDFGSTESLYEYSKLLSKMEEKEESVKYLKEAIDHGYLKAIFRRSIELKNLEESGKLPKEQEGQWKELLKTAVEGGHAKANYFYATLLDEKEKKVENLNYFEDGDEEKLIESSTFYKKGAEEGCIESMYKYGIYLYNNFNDKQKKQESLRFIKKASCRGFIEATYKYGLILVEGDIGIPQDMNKGSRFIKIAAENGHIDAIGSYGQLFLEGKGVQANTELAIKYFKEAIEKGSALAMNEYANMLSQGKGVPIDYDLATKYYKMAIDKGYARAMNDYAYMIDHMEDAPSNYESSFEYFKLAIKHGDDDAYVNLSFKYMSGDGVSINHNLGVKYAKLALKKGSPGAFYNYAYMLRNGEGVPVNYEEAIKYLRIAIDKGFSHAMLLYAIMLEKGEGVPPNEEESNKYYKMAISKGNINAMLYYGSKIEKETGNKDLHLKYLRKAIDHGSAEAMNIYAVYIEKEKKTSDYMTYAARYYKMSAEKGDIGGMCNYGRVLFDGLGVPANIEKGLEYTKKCIDRGCYTAMNNYATILFTGKGGVPININEAIKYFKMSVDGGCPEGLSNYGFMLLYGNNVPVDTKEAAKYIKQAADMGDVKSMHTYAHLLTVGMGVPVDIREAEKYYKKAIDKGCAESMFNYALILEEGRGIPVNIKESVKYLKMAIDKGFPNAMDSYALMNLRGTGIPVNYENAVKYFKMAIDKGFSPSMRNYGSILANGRGVPVDEYEASKYYKMAIDKGNVDAMCDLASMLFYQFMESIKLIVDSRFNRKKLFDATFNYATKLTNPYQAVKYYQMAIDKGSQRAVNEYHQMVNCLFRYMSVLMRAPNMDKTLELIYSPKKKQDYQINYFELGYSYLIKHSKYHLAKAIEYFKESAKLDYPLALFYLGKIYSNGEFIPINNKDAVDYFLECIKIITNQNDLIYTEKEIELNNFIKVLSLYNIGLIFYVDFRYKEMSEHYFKQAISSNYPLCLNGLGLFKQLCLKNNKEAKKLYQMAAENKFSLSFYNLGYLNEKENKIDEAIENYIKASENENEPLTFDQLQLFDIQYEISKAFVICLTNLKLVAYYLSKSEFSKSKKYFIKSLSKLNRFNFKFNRNISGENVINESEYLTIFSYMRYFYFNSDLFNIRNQKNLSNEFIENLLTNLKFDFVESEIFGPKNLFDFIVNNRNTEFLDQFKLEIEFIIQRMENILYTYPYDILFGRISIEKSETSPSFNACRKNINKDFYEGLRM